MACHDVRRGEVRGRPAGGRHRRRPDRAPDRARRARPRCAGRSSSSRTPRAGRSRRELGLDALDPGSDDVAARVLEESEGAGADVVFEVSGSAAGMLAATRLRLPARADRRRRDLPRAEAGRAVRRLLQGARHPRRPRVRAGGFRRRDRAARGRLARSRAADHRRRAARARARRCSRSSSRAGPR